MARIRSALLLALLAGAGPAHAQQVGLGASLKQGENTVFVPIRTQTMLWEPFLNHGHVRQEDTSNSAPGGTVVFSQQVWEVGLGVFWRRPVMEQGQLYAGPRLGYVRATSTIDLGAGGQDRHSDGLELTPVVGYDYAFNTHFSLGAEVGYRYFRMKGAATQSSPDYRSDTKATDNGTVTALVARFYF